MKGTQLWFLVWRTKRYGVQVKPLCSPYRKGLREELREHFTDSEWRQAQRNGAKIERLVVRHNAKAKAP